MTSPPLPLRTLATAAALLLAGCAAAPPMGPPTAPESPAWRETVPGWMAAAPADTLARGPWWHLLGDAQLDALVPQVAVSNQTVAGAAAAVEFTQASVREQRAAFFPTVSVDAGASRSGTRSPPAAANSFRLGAGATWEPDLWGRIAGTVATAQAQAQASEADLAAATLSAQAAFVTAYLGVREADAETALLQSTLEGYQRAAKITQNRYDAGLAPRSDVLQAQTQLANAQSDLAGVRQVRAQQLHAMAVLAGQAPAAFTLPDGTWNATTAPAVPPGLPSALLQRRPDIAAAERRVAAANAGIGVARAAWFPGVTLSADLGQAASHLGDLLSASATTWSFGLALAETIFDAGARSARVDEARASWRESVAAYRQSVLTAFQEVEDDLTAANTLEQQQALRRVASQAADQAEVQVFNRYRAGQVSYADVVTAQVSALSARRALLQASLSRQLSAVQLVVALGGGWDAAAPREAAGAPPGSP